MSVLRYLHKHDIRLPIRPIFGPMKGQIEWRQPVYSTIVNMLHNPTYAGSYAYGRYQIDARRRVTGKAQGRFQAKIEDWKVLIHDKLPAYITWEQYLANVNRLKQNGSMFDTAGVVRDGESLLAGLAFCGRCGRRMFPHYKGKTKPAAYVCPGNYPSGGVSKCQRIASGFIDDLVVEQVLRAIEPASLDLSLQATDEIRKEHDHVQAQWRRRLEDAVGRSERARQQYDAVDPTNRRVAAQLERHWEEMLSEQRRLEEEHDRFLRDQPSRLSQDDVNAIGQLSASIPRLWSQSSSFSADHKQIVRHLIDRVVIEIDGRSEIVEVAIRWHGGFESRHEVIRSVAKYDQLKDFDRLKARLNELWRGGRSTTAIAKTLNAEGFRTTTAGKAYSRHTVRKLLDSWGLTEPQRAQISENLAALGSNEWWLLDLSCRLSIDRSTLARWCRRGWVHARQLSGQRRWWIIWADEEECKRLKQLYEHGRGWPHHGGSPYPAELKTPKAKPKKIN